MVDVPLAARVAWSASVPQESILPSSGAIPRVIATVAVRGEWGQAGVRRRVVLEDGHDAAAEVLASEQPSRFRYQVWGYANAARLMIERGIGEFILTEENGQTRVSWTYSFQPRLGIGRPLLTRFVDGTWADSMRRVLATMQTAAERYANPAAAVTAPEPDSVPQWA